MTTCYQRIKSELIIPGKGSPIKNGIVIIKDDIIHYVGTAENQPKDIATFERDIFIPIIMPGLWDCHVHFFGFNKVAMSSSKELFDVIATTPAAIAVVRSLSALSNCIEYGITSVREVGGYGCHLKKLVNEGTIIKSPNIYPAGKCLGITGGHGDFHNYPLEFMCQLSKNDNITTLCDGHTECLKAVRSNIRNGADCIKVHATGGVLSINDALDARQFSDSELKTIVSEAQRSGKICAAHCHGRDGIEAAIECGVYTIEHGSFLDEALAQKMKAKGTMLVPTRYVSEMFNELIDADKDGSKFTESMRIKAKKCIYAGRNAFQIALKYGLKVAMGTDMIYPNWGENSKELEYYVRDGMTELEAIECGTANGAMTLGPYRNLKSGQIKVGYDADIIGLAANPLNDIKVLQDADSIVMVWKGGNVLKNRLRNIKSKL